MAKKYAFGFVTDPLDNFDRDAETTLFLMREIQRRGHTIFACEPKDLFLKQNELMAYVKQIELTGHHRCFYRILNQAPLALSSLDCLFLRKDPPFDLAYLHHLYLLRTLEKKVLMVNEPTAILECNEKLMTLDFSFAPRTLVSSRTDVILGWGNKFERGVVLKPIHCGGGVGVRWLKKSKIQNLKSKEIIKKMTKGEKQPIICQEYLPAAKKGDKRILMWNGKVLGAFLRKPKKGEFRANLHQGGHFVKDILNANDLKIVRQVGPWTKAKGLYFVGLDVIGSHLTEINVTSPMGIREVNVLYQKKVERIILDSILKQI